MKKIFLLLISTILFSCATKTEFYVLRKIPNTNNTYEVRQTGYLSTKKLELPEIYDSTCCVKRYVALKKKDIKEVK